MGKDELWKGLRLPGKPPWYLWVGVGVLILGTLLISISSVSPPGDLRGTASPPDPGEAGRQGVQGSELFATARALEAELEEILAKVEGAGRVKVSVALAATPVREYATNTRAVQRSTEEKNQSGGTRVTTETDEDGQLVLARTSTLQGEEPVVVRESKPEIQGVVVVAEGGRDPYVRLRLIEAVRTLWALAPHQVQVLPMGN
ncbi:MAG TPA: hypothetical protein DEA73_04705 [Peptococcaceae bacterium]|nr:MAG: Stage III sporulation protein AG [Moorella sp. 60_41]HBT47172.1 hypothetical protein [Peptococcaceae bacterium]